MPRFAGATRLVGAACLVILLGLPAASAGAADPQSDDSSAPVALSARLNGTLGPAPAAGWQGGTEPVAYYAFQYKGDEATVSINLQVYPDDETILDKVTFVVYGPRTAREPNFVYVQSGSQPRQVPNVSANLISKDAGQYVVQVRNDARVPIYFAIWTEGATVAFPSVLQPAPVAGLPTGPLPAVPALPPPPIAAPQPSTTVTAPAADGVTSHNLVTPLEGHLASREYLLFEFTYPGDESVYTIDVVMRPDDPVLLDHAGFQVFQPDGTLQVKGGSQTGLVPNVSANVISTVPGVYTVKVFNDNEQPAMDFSISLVTGTRENVH